MKIAVLNYTGTVGKTTIAAHLLSPRLNNAPIFSIETINQSADDFGMTTSKMDGKKYGELLRKIILLDDAIIDVGASNVQSFLDGVFNFEESHIEFDCFLVPVTSGVKEQKETINIISTLANIGIPKDKIHIVFNRVDSDVKEEFNLVLNFAKMEKKCIANPEVAIYENDVFNMLYSKKMNIKDIIEDATDYKAKARELLKNEKPDEKQINHCTNMHIAKSLAKTVNKNLDYVFNCLFKG